MDSELLTALTSLHSTLGAKLPALTAAAAAAAADVKHAESEHVSAERTAAVLAEARIAPEWAQYIQDVLFTPSMIRAKVAELGARITKEYAGKKVLCVGLLNGAFIFMADLLRTLGVEYEIDFLSVSSYGAGTHSSGSVKIKKDLSVDPYGKHVLIIEDLIDTGTTLDWIKNYLRSKNCASVAMCCLLDKKARRTADVFVDYIGWECPDEFVVGYGMDFAGAYRCMPFVGVLKEEAYAGPKALKPAPPSPY